MVVASRLLRNVNSKQIQSAIKFHLSRRTLATTAALNNVVKSSLPDIEIPDVSITDLVWKDVGKWPNHVAFECAVTGKKHTFSELRSKCSNLARGLRKKLKLQQGDTVAILLPNTPDYHVALLGSIEAGLIVTTVNPIYTADEIARQIVNSGAKAIFTLAELWPTVEAALKSVKSKVHIFTISQPGTSAPQGCINITEFTDNKVDFDLPHLDQNDVALLPYSSGTTGLPKGVELTHRNIVSNMSQLNHPQLTLNIPTSENSQDKMPVVLPIFHIYGLTTSMLSTMLGVKQITLPKFTPELYISILEKHRPDLLYIVPPIVLFLAMHPLVTAEHLKSVRGVCSGAAPLGAMDEDRFMVKAPKNCKIMQGFGMTETSPVVTMTCATRNLPNTGSIGEVVPNTLVKLVKVDDPEGKPLGTGERGELLVKGPQVMKGYYKNPTATKESFTEDGWFKTGDLMYYDDKNQFYVADRLKELIKVKGFQVAPAELEEILRSHPEVGDAAVIGVPHEQYGEVPRAYIVTKPNVKINMENVENFVAEKVASYKKLAGGVEIIEQIPKNASGKIMRKQLKEMYTAKA